MEKIAALFFTLKRKKNRSDLKPWLDHYDTSVPKELFIPDITLNDVLRRSVELHKDHAVFSYFGRKLSYIKFDRAVERFAAAFQELGVKKGDRVAVILPNTPQFLLSYWATLRIGAIIVPINPLLSGPEIRTQLTISEPCLLIVLDLIYTKIRNDVRDCRIPSVLLTSIESFMPAGVRIMIFFKKRLKSRKKHQNKTEYFSFEDLSADRPAALLGKIKSDDTAALLFTGGVTGTPKAVELTHFNLVANVLQTRAWLGDFKDGHDIVMGVLPFFHSYGMTTCHHLAIQAGAMLILEPRFRVQRIIRLVKKYKVTILPGVPTMYRAILDALSDSKKSFYPVRVCVSGGAPLSFDLKQEFEERTSSTLVEGYGLSEASPLTHCNPLFGVQHAGSIGLPCPNTAARIVHLKSGKTLQPGQLGELQVRGPQVMRRYWKNDKETKNVLSADGWLSTGDIARMDEDGFFYIVDRKKDIILTGGFNVYPSEVENVLNRHPSVKECAVTGMPNDYYGQAVLAFIVLHDGKPCDKNELYDYCQDRLARFKIPKRIEFVTELPKNFLGKVVRRKLAE